MLRRILVNTLFDPDIEITINSALDIALLRAAHQALLRQQDGLKDSFLFLFCGKRTKEEASSAIARYGFPDVTVACIDTFDEEGDEIDYFDIREMIGNEISAWLQSNHPAALTSLALQGYDGLDFWWSGIEAFESELDFVGDYANTLPTDHRNKAATWLEILTEQFDLAEPCLANEMKLALYAATLCEWLHGFQVASGDGFSNFDAISVCDALRIDDFYLGFLMGQANPRDSLDEMLSNAEDDDLAGIKQYALQQAMERGRMMIRDGLANFFDSDTALFWTLHSAIWPKYNEPAEDACNELVNPSSFEDIGEAMEAWEFVTNGWTDSADE
jgi:hypothetical protein